MYSLPSTACAASHSNIFTLMSLANSAHSRHIEWRWMPTEDDDGGVAEVSPSSCSKPTGRRAANRRTPDPTPTDYCTKSWRCRKIEVATAYRHSGKSFQ